MYEGCHKVDSDKMAIKWKALFRMRCNSHTRYANLLANFQYSRCVDHYMSTSGRPKSIRPVRGNLSQRFEPVFYLFTKVIIFFKLTVYQMTLQGSIEMIDRGGKVRIMQWMKRNLPTIASEPVFGHICCKRCCIVALNYHTAFQKCWWLARHSCSESIKVRRSIYAFSLGQNVR